jgi:hypothetical protein
MCHVIGPFQSKAICCARCRTSAGPSSRKNTRGENGLARSIDRHEPTLAQTVGPMLDLSVVTARPTGMMVIDDQATAVFS